MSEVGVTILGGIATVITLYGFACLIADFLEEVESRYRMIHFYGKDQ